MPVVTLMIGLQIPEILYDLASGEPVEIASPDQLTDELHGRITYVVIHGRGYFFFLHKWEKSASVMPPPDALPL